MIKKSSKCTKNQQKYAEILKISAKIYKNMQNPRIYINNWCKLTSAKSQTPTPGHDVPVHITKNI